MVQGTLFITNSYVCFYSNWWANERKVCRLGFFLLLSEETHQETLRFKEVTAIEKKFTARIIPNAIEITVQPKEEEEERKVILLLLLHIWIVVQFVPGGEEGPIIPTN